MSKISEFQDYMEKAHQAAPPHPGLVFDDAKHRWVIADRTGQMATSWKHQSGATITVESRRSKSAGLGGKRYVARHNGEEYGALTLDGAKDWVNQRMG